MKLTKSFFIGNVPIGGGAPVTIQSMTNTDTRNAESTIMQIKALAMAHCDIVRVSVYDDECITALPEIVAASPVPLVADIHYRSDLAIKAMECGISKVRINPGNIGNEEKIKRVVDCAKSHNVPIRIGVNSGSVEKHILARDGGVTPQGMVDSALAHARLLEQNNFYNIVLSMKASDVRTTFEAYSLASKQTDYPLHVGVTEAGLPGAGNIKSAIGIGALLLQGIGDTIRVSLTGDPIPEGIAGLDILKAIGLRKVNMNIVSCPTCGRTNIAVSEIAIKVEKALKDIKVPLTVAVMGCVVNGPGEAREADIGIAGGGVCTGSHLQEGVLFEKGKTPQKVEGDLATILIEKAKSIAKQKEKEGYE